MADYMDEVDNFLNNDSDDANNDNNDNNDNNQGAEAFKQYEDKLAAMEGQLKDLTEKNRKLTQYALGEQVDQGDYNQRIKQALDQNPLGYTQEVVDTAKNTTLKEVDERLAQFQEVQAAQTAIAEARQKYPGMAEHQDVIGMFADKITQDIQNGNRNDIKANEYGKIIDEAVGMFSKKYGPTLPRTANHVMSLDVGTQQNTAYGNDKVSDLLKKSDDDFLKEMNKYRGQTFQF